MANVWLLEGPGLTICRGPRSADVGLPASEVFVERSRETWPVLAERSFRTGRTWVLPGSTVIGPRRKDRDAEGEIIGASIYSEAVP